MKSNKACIPAISALSIAILALAPSPANAARIDYTIDAGVEVNDNVLMSATDPKDETSFRTGLGFLIAEDTSTIHASIDGRIDYWNYTQGVYADTVEGNLSGRLDWFIVPQAFSFTIEDRLQAQTIDRFRADAPDNRQLVNVLSLGPNLHLNVGRNLRGQFELRWIDSTAEVTDEFDSTRIAAMARLVRQIDQTSNLSFSLQGQDVDFDDDILARDYRRYDTYARYEKTLNRFAIGADAGYSRATYDRGGGHASYPLLRADLDWLASNRGTLSVHVSRQLSDATSAALSGINDATAPPGALITNAAAVDASLYKESTLRLTYTHAAVRNVFSISPYWESIDYLDPTSFDEDRAGVRVDYTRHLNPTWDVNLNGSAYRSKFPGLNQEVDDYRIGVSLNKRWNRNWSSSLRYSTYTRNDDLLPRNPDQNIWYLTVVYRNR